MFVLPMLGRSSRFFDAGYTVPKYKLDVCGASLFSRVLSSFLEYFESDKFTFIVRSDFKDAEWVSAEAENLGILNFSVIEVDRDTTGQGETVYLATKEIKILDEEIYIFNIDTILTNFTKSTVPCDGYLETFLAKGDHWSFAEVDMNDNVIRTTEKIRISDNCSNGLYYFKSASLYNYYFEKYHNNYEKETYIAPMYNLMINDEKIVKVKKENAEAVLLCGTPDEYLRLKC